MKKDSREEMFFKISRLTECEPMAINRKILRNSYKYLIYYTSLHLYKLDGQAQLYFLLVKISAQKKKKDRNLRNPN